MVATLLIAAYELLTVDPEARLSVPAVDHFGWLIDELASVAPKVDRQLLADGTGRRLEGAAAELLAWETARAQAAKERIAAGIMAKFGDAWRRQAPDLGGRR